MADDVLLADNSILSETAKCSTAAFIRYGVGLATRGTSLALASGSALHLGLARWAEGDPIEKAVKVMADAYERSVDKYLARLKVDTLPADDRRFEPSWVEAVLHQYLTRYEGKFPFKVIRGSTEKPISAPFPRVNLPSGKEVIYVARLDGIVRRWESGDKWSLDWKSTKKASDWWIAKQQVSSQFTGQRWLTEQAGVGEVAGVVLAVIELPEPHRSENNCKEHKVSYQECSVKHAGSNFVYITRGLAEIEAWKWTARKLIRKFDQLKTRAEQDGMDAMPDIPMEGRFNGGCTFCEFREFCKFGRNVRPANLRAMFVEEVWNPLAVGED